MMVRYDIFLAIVLLGNSIPKLARAMDPVTEKKEKNSLSPRKIKHRKSSPEAPTMEPPLLRHVASEDDYEKLHKMRYHLLSTQMRELSDEIAEARGEITIIKHEFFDCTQEAKHAIKDYVFQKIMNGCDQHQVDRRVEKVNRKIEKVQRKFDLLDLDDE
jgi:hypothetical protein